MQQKQRISELDALRGIGVLMVMLFHYTYRYYEYTGKAMPAFSFFHGCLGVELFFMISGFVIFMTVEATPSPGRFLFLRFTRLFPAYWFAIILTSCAVAFFGPVYMEIPLKFILFNFTMVQEFFDVQNVDPAYWSLFPELMFYGLMFLTLVFKLHHYFNWVLLAWLLLIFTELFTSTLQPLSEVMNLRYGPLFIAGILFYQWKKAKEMRQSFPILKYVMLASTAFFVFIIYPMSSALVIMLFYGLFFLLVFNGLAFLNWRVLSLAGAISYPLYLVHTSIGFAVMDHVELSFWPELLMTCVVVIILALPIHYFIEKPFMHYLRKKWVKAPLQPS